jgi:phenylacetate-CoA ligase
LRAILDNQITVVCCTPTYALRLAEAAAHEKIQLDRSKVRTLIVAGEPGGSIPSVRSQLEKLWRGARVFDHHGMTEVGPVTYQCPARAGVLHIIESAYYAEVINPETRQPVEGGQPGELVLTTLGRLGSPVLRYRTGDLVKCRRQNGPFGRAKCRTETPPCACGTFELALEGGILGRTDDMVVVRGVNVYPSAVEDLVRACAGIAEYQAEVSQQGSLPELTIKIEPALDCAEPSALVRKLATSFENALALRVLVSLVAPGTLPRFEMKSKRWIVRG